MKKKTPQKTAASSQGTNLDVKKGIGSSQNPNTKSVERCSRISLAEIVDIFLNTKEQAESSKENISNKIGREEVDICDLFVEINGQDIAAFGKNDKNNYKIYYGKAWVNSCTQTESFRIRFKEKLSFENQKKVTSFFIKWEEFEKLNSGESKREDFEKMTDKRPRDIYLFAPPHSKKGSQYINFTCKTLNCLECRET